MQTYLMTVQGESNNPLSYDAVAKKLGLPEEAIDHSMAVTLIDPDRKLFAVRVFAEMCSITSSGESGPFSDPQIDSFGPPKN